VSVRYQSVTSKTVKYTNTTVDWTKTVGLSIGLSVVQIYQGRI